MSERTLLVTPSNRDTELTTLAFALPVLLAGMVLRRSSPERATLLHASVSGYLLYVGLSYGLDGRTTHELLLLSVALLTASTFALAAAVRGFRTRDPTSFRAPRGLGLVLLGAGGLLAVTRGWPLLRRVLTAASPVYGGTSPYGGPPTYGGPPPYGGAAAWPESYSTMAAVTVDLGILVPAFLLAGFLVLRRRTPGLVLAVPLLGMTAAMGTALVSYALVYATGGPGGVAAAMPRDVMMALLGLLLLPAAAVWALADMLRSHRG